MTFVLTTALGCTVDLHSLPDWYGEEEDLPRDTRVNSFDLADSGVDSASQDVTVVPDALVDAADVSNDSGFDSASQDLMDVPDALADVADDSGIDSAGEDTMADADAPIDVSDTSADDVSTDTIADVLTDTADALTDTADALTDTADVPVDTAVDIAADITDDADAGIVYGNIIFVTSETFVPDFAFDGDRYAGADQACNDAAEGATLSGNFVALLTGDWDEFNARLTGARGWVRVDGTAVADTAFNLWAGDFFHLFQYDEFGARIDADPYFWTGDADRDCDDWAGAAETSVGVMSNGYHLQSTWGGSLRWCNLEGRLLCAQVDLDMEVQPAPVIGDTRLLFLSHERPPTDSGLEPFDTLCQSEFEAAFGLDTGRQFRALVGSTDVAPADRISHADAIWVRADGAVFADNTEDFLDGAWDTWPARDVEGVPFETSDAIFGAVDPRTPGTDENTCVGWSSNLVEDTFLTGSPRVWGARFSSRLRPCDATHYVYCAEDIL